MTMLKLLALLVFATEAQAVVPAPSPLELYDAVTKAAVANHPPSNELSAAITSERRSLGPKPAEAETRAALERVLARLGPHAATLRTDEEQAYWSMRAVTGDEPRSRLKHVGAWFERRGARWYATRVFPGSPAAEAGLLRGDEIIAVDGRPLEPVRSFTRIAGTAKATVEVKRVPWGKTETLAVGTRTEALDETLFRAMRESRHVHDLGGAKLGFVWLSGASEERFRTELADAVRRFERDTDALVIDLRGGYFGGSDMAYLEPFFLADGSPSSTKPLVVLVDGETRGGKEALAWLLKRRGRATLVGERTAGAVQARAVIQVVPDRLALEIVSGVAAGELTAALEGQGVEPDVRVESPLIYAAGADPQMAEGLRIAAAAVKK